MPQQILGLKVCDPAMGSGAFLVETCRQLGDVLVTAWHAHDCLPPTPPDEDEVLHARRLVAQRCLYGVDKNPMAVDLAKLSLWLATLARDHPFTFLDHAMRCGDSLVGLTRQQIARFHWKDTPQQAQLGQERIAERVQAATRVRQEILEAGDEVPFLLKQQKLALADESLGLVRFAGNLAIAAFFAGDNDRQRQLKRDTLLGKFTEYLKGDMAQRPTAEERQLRAGPKGITPFHWEIEFPEVFDRENPGFDCMIGNPPFLGGSLVSERYGMRYFQWLVMAFPGCRHRCDLVAYFFRRAFAFIRNRATLGLIATNTIAQGDTREGGLFAITTSGGHIYSAARRLRWPGQSAVIVSVLHVNKKRVPSTTILDGQPVRRISAYLLDSDNDHTPSRLSANPFFSNGSNIYGQGFVFDDTDPKASPDIARLSILEKNPACAARIFPYIGGEEINSAPAVSTRRYVINLSDIADESELEHWPELKDIVSRMVKPERMELGPNPNNVPLKRKWWAYQAHRPELYSRLKSLRSVLACSQVSAQFCFARLPTNWVYSHTVNLFCLETLAGFAVIQSRVHEIWARLFASSMKDDMRYTPSDCFETFPFPEGFETNAQLEAAGNSYYEFRAALMVRNSEGLTKTYNRFHDPNERSFDILKLRELHASMDLTVLHAYGWTDLGPTNEFVLDYEEEEGDEEGGSRPHRKPWRYRWPDDFRDKVLARLLELNKERADQERLAGAPGSSGKRRGRRRSAAEKGPGLF
jgi:hypothetical protein